MLLDEIQCCFALKYAHAPINAANRKQWQWYKQYTKSI